MGKEKRKIPPFYRRYFRKKRNMKKILKSSAEELVIGFSILTLTFCHDQKPGKMI